MLRPCGARLNPPPPSAPETFDKMTNIPLYLYFYVTSELFAIKIKF